MFFSEKLIVMLTNYEDIFLLSSSIEFLQNDFQRIKYPFVFISQAFFGLVTIHENSVNAYFSK